MYIYILKYCSKNHQKKTKRVLKCLFACLFGLGITASANSQDYCTTDLYELAFGCSGGNNKITNFKITDAIINLTNETGMLSCGENSYSDFSHLSASVIAGSTFSFSVGIGHYQSHVKLWIDWNNDGVFDQSDEVIGQAVGIHAGNSYTDTFTVPSDTPIGNYRLRVRITTPGDVPNSNLAIFDPCTTYLIGETEDYTLKVIATPTCFPPTDLNATPTSFTDNTLSWTSTANNFEIEYGTKGFIQGNGSIVTANSNTISITGLTKDTFYQFYVRQNCGSDWSLWQGPYTFWHGYCRSTSASEAFGHIISFTTTGGLTTNIQNSNSGFSPEGYGDFTTLYVDQVEGESIVFEAKSTQFNQVTRMNLWIDWNQDMIFDDDTEKFYTTTNTQAAFTHTGTISVPAGTQPGNYRMRIRSKWGSTVSPDACGVSVQGETEDYILKVVPAPTACDSPTNISGIPISLTSMQLYWTSAGNNFEIEYGLKDFIQGTGTIESVNNGTSTIISNLTTNAYYDFYVRRDCGSPDGFSNWNGPYYFHMEYCAANSGGSTIFSIIESVNTTGGVSNIQNTDTGFSPNGYGYFVDISVSQYQMQPINFSVAMKPNNYPAILKIWVDWNNNMSFDSNEEVYYSQADYPNGAMVFEGSILVPFGISPGDYRMRVRARHYVPNLGHIPPNSCGGHDYAETEDYTFTVLPPVSSCETPFMPTATFVSVTSVSLAWISSGTTFDVEYGQAGFMQGSSDGTIISGITFNSYILSGLTSGVNYEYYVRQDCGDEQSTWVGPIPFNTIGTYSDSISTMFNPNPQILSPACGGTMIIDIPVGYSLEGLNLQYTMTSASPQTISQQRSVLYSTTLNTGETEIVSGEVNSNFPGIHSYNRDVDFANGISGPMQITFELKAWRTSGGSGCGNQIYVEDGSWKLIPVLELIPTCPGLPSDLNSVVVSETSVSLTWTEAVAGAIHQLQWGGIGFDPIAENGIIVSNLATSYLLSGLDPFTSYEFYVRRYCGVDDHGEWVGPFMFNSGYCLPTSNLVFFFMGFQTSDAIENINYTGSFGQGATGYINNTDMVIEQAAGEEFSFVSNYAGGSSSLRIWIDWNKNFVFEDDEQVFYLSSSSGLKSGNIIIPLNVTPGNYRMRVRSEQGLNANPSACGEIAMGEAMDFTLSVVASTGCTSVTQLTLETVTSDSAEISWTAGGNETSWNVEYGETGFIQGTGIIQIVTQPNISIYNLDSNKNYTIYIQADCEADGQSIWKSIPFTTPQTANIDNLDLHKFSYYPNPVSDILYFTTKTPIEKIVISNMLGQEVNASLNSDNTILDISDLPIGNYLVKITIEGVSKTIKIIKQ